jgi:hypothetical protein
VAFRDAVDHPVGLGLCDHLLIDKGRQAGLSATAANGVIVHTSCRDFNPGWIEHHDGVVVLASDCGAVSLL